MMRGVTPKAPIQADANVAKRAWVAPVLQTVAARDAEGVASSSGADGTLYS
ncbi:MAG: hypothetical protein ACJ8EB_05395 [Allosphingosinicella sp.]